MLALVILGIALGYLTVAVLATVAAVRWARKKGLTKGKRWLSGIAVALVFYLIPFWDWIPTMVAHQYLCATEGKSEIRKTVVQWKTENADVVGTLRYDRDAKLVRAGEYYRFPLNQRLASERKDPIEVFLSIKREEGRIMDMKNGEVLAKYVDFIAGYAPLGVGGESAWKFWLRGIGRCTGESQGIGTFELIREEIRSLGSGK